MSSRIVLATAVAFVAGVLITVSVYSGDDHCPTRPPVDLTPAPAQTTAVTAPPTTSAPKSLYQDPNCKKGVTITKDPPLLILERLRNDSSATKPPTVCKRAVSGSSFGWVFVEYQPSAMESRWAQKIKDVERNPGEPLCQLWNAEFHGEGAKLMQAMATHRANIEATFAATCGNLQAMSRVLPGDFDHALFSRFKYQYKCLKPPCIADERDPNIPEGTVRYGYIEPLVGLLRHPNLCNDYRTPGWGSLLNKDYMLLDRWPLWATNELAEKVLYFDAGASLWSEGAGGASQGWLYDAYEKMCTPLTDYYAWEITPVSANDVYNAMPGHVRPKFHWYNIGLQTTPESWNNPHNHILSQASKEDIVIWKIDFDATQIEDQLIKQIMQFPELAERIDELFFEHHINMEFLREHWGTGQGTTFQTESIKLFQDLRKMGIRAHSWV